MIKNLSFNKMIPNTYWNDLSMGAKSAFLSFHYQHSTGINSKRIKDACPMSRDYGPAGIDIMCETLCEVLFGMDTLTVCPCSQFGCENAFKALTLAIEGRK